MTAFENIQTSIAPELEQLNLRIRESLASSNDLMNSTVDYYLKSKGKLIRPILVILSAKLFGSVNESAMSAAASVEMLHNASLIHDDVIDETHTRRGRATINEQWGNQIAVLVGDFFVSSALHQAICTGDIRIINSLSSLGRELSLGEIDQINNSHGHDLSEEAYFKVITSKTASLFVSCVEMGAYAVGAEEDKIEPLRKFAELLGQCFQIRDDIFDYCGNESIGKPTGNDLREGKVTLPLLYAISRESLPERDSMLALVAKEELTDEEIEKLLAFARDNGGIEYASRKMAELRDRGSAILRQAYPHTPAREAFISIFDYIIERSK